MTTMDELTEAFDAELDESGDVSVAGYPLAPSRVLRQCDPIAYRCALLDWADACGIDTDDLE